MGMDFTSRTYPFVTFFVGDEGEESHQEPADESVKSAVQGYEHPLFSLNGPVTMINRMRGFANSVEPALEGEIKPDTIKEMMQAAMQAKFPADMLLMAADLKEALPTRDGMGDAKEIIEKITGYVGSFENPKNYELFMAFAVDGAEKAQQLIEKAQSDPNKKATPIGSEFDDIIFYKPRDGKPVLRTNKEVVQFFTRRMLNGTDFFAHLPLGQNMTGM